MLRNLDFSGLQEIADGTVTAAVNHHLQRAIRDCEDRPGDETARKVKLEVLLKPLTTQDGACVDVVAECQISSTTPKHISKPVECRVKAGGRAVFNDLSEDDVDQRTLDEQDPNFR